MGRRESRGPLVSENRTGPEPKHPPHLIPQFTLSHKHSHEAKMIRADRRQRNIREARRKHRVEVKERSGLAGMTLPYELVQESPQSSTKTKDLRKGTDSQAFF
jgi:hypothetical protein